MRTTRAPVDSAQPSARCVARESPADRATCTGSVSLNNWRGGFHVHHQTVVRVLRGALAAGLLAAAVLAPGYQASADETCNSPFMRNLIKGQEDYVYVWTLGVEGMGDGSDKLVTIDVKPGIARATAR